jgi:peptidyl-prolyl cis-trans isomerase B (cyclophilin B)
MAIITGHISLAQIKRSGENGRVLAIVGVVLGYLNILSWIIFVTLAVLRFAFVDYDMTGLQPGMSELFEFRRGIGDHHGH